MTLLNIKNKKEPNYLQNSTQPTRKEPNYLYLNQNYKKENNSSSSLMIGEGVIITGTIKADNQVTIQGTIEGDIDCSNVTINKSGLVKGKIQTENMTVEGKVEGEFNINSILRIKSNGSVMGKTFYGDIQIEEGGKLQGEIKSEENKKNIEETQDWKPL
tara:strand:- start:402 stop:878 length:477 start_codon:yes stop_codon:yes gene_type:complete